MIFEFYGTDLYGQLKVQNTLDEVLLLHTCIRMLFVLKEVDCVLPTLHPENILIDSHGNPCLSLFGSHFTVTYPDQYCSPE